jgi:hypothetical protein
MATTTSLKSYETSVTVLTGASEVNSVAHGSLGAISGAGSGTILDNTTLLDLYADFEFITGTLGGAPLVGGKVFLYQWTSLDAANYETSPAAGAWTPDLIDPEHLVGTFEFWTTGTSQKLHIHRKPLTSGKVKFQLLNMSGQALPSSGASIVCYRYNLLNT